MLVRFSSTFLDLQYKFDNTMEKDFGSKVFDSGRCHRVSTNAQVLFSLRVYAVRNPRPAFNSYELLLQHGARLCCVVG